MEKIKVKSATHSYNVFIGEGIRFKLTRLIEQYTSGIIITDEAIAKLYLNDIKSQFNEQKFTTLIIPVGESSKSIQTYYDIQTSALKNGLDRKSIFIALGGGVVGDLTGFAASTFMRGVDFIQIPTTILAHDSSVGGKVAINHEIGKNMIGSFYPPKAVIYDVETLNTLPSHEIRSGYAEIIKEAYLADPDYVKKMLKTDIRELNKETLINDLAKGIQIKRDIVERDEYESSVRMFLNLGHTLSHAIEVELGYGKITHGESVALGMVFAFRLSERIFDVDLKIPEYKEWLKQNEYPLTLPFIHPDKLLERMKSDKKTSNQVVQMVLLKSIGKPVVQNVSDELLLAHLSEFMKEFGKR